MKTRKAKVYGSFEFVYAGWDAPIYMICNGMLRAVKMLKIALSFDGSEECARVTPHYFLEVAGIGLVEIKDGLGFSKQVATPDVTIDLKGYWDSPESFFDGEAQNSLFLTTCRVEKLIEELIDIKPYYLGDGENVFRGNIWDGANVIYTALQLPETIIYDGKSWDLNKKVFKSINPTAYMTAAEVQRSQVTQVAFFKKEEDRHHLIICVGNDAYVTFNEDAVNKLRQMDKDIETMIENGDIEPEC